MANRETTMFGGHLSKSSDVLGSMKRSLGRKPKCQCKHHQQKLLQKQEEQRKQLQAKLAEKGFKKAFNTTYNKPYHGRNFYSKNANLLKLNMIFSSCLNFSSCSKTVIETSLKLYIPLNKSSF